MTVSAPTLTPTWLDPEAWRAGLARGEPGILHAVVAEIEDLTTVDASNPFEALLDAEDRDRAARFRFAEDRHRFVIAHAILRLVASQALGIQPQALDFGAHPRAGFPPRLVGLADSAPRLSLSHSGPYIAVALGRGQTVGIDVEWPRPMRDLDALANTVLTNAEMRALTALPPAARASVFLRWWTAKEAALKAQGSGLATAPDQVILDFDETHMPSAAFVPSDGAGRRYPTRSFDPFGSSHAIVTIAACGYPSLHMSYCTAREFLDPTRS